MLDLIIIKYIPALSEDVSNNTTAGKGVQIRDQYKINIKSIKV